MSAFRLYRNIGLVGVNVLLAAWFASDPKAFWISPAIFHVNVGLGSEVASPSNPDINIADEIITGRLFPFSEYFQ